MIRAARLWCNKSIKTHTLGAQPVHMPSGSTKHDRAYLRISIIDVVRFRVLGGGGLGEDTGGGEGGQIPGGHMMS